jgi:hypothetical protein
MTALSRAAIGVSAALRQSALAESIEIRAKQ